MSVGERTLDGNAIGGQLLELFGVDLTAAPCVCDGCGAEEEVGAGDPSPPQRFVDHDRGGFHRTGPPVARIDDAVLDDTRRG